LHIFDERDSAAAEHCRRGRSRLQALVKVSYLPLKGAASSAPTADFVSLATTHHLYSDFELGEENTTVTKGLIRDCPNPSGGFVGPGAEVADRTAGAVRPLGLADSPAVEDQQVGDEGPLFSGNDPAELLLDLILLVALGEA
jgi:hypothetical protein